MRPPNLITPALVVLCVLAWYLTAWQGWADFVGSIDFNDGVFEDFMGPYYTMGNRVFETRAPVSGFYYSPFFAILLGVFDGVHPSTASWAWLAFEVAATLALVLLPLAIVRPTDGWRRNLYLLVALTSFPLVHNFHWGQMSVPLTALVFGALLCHERGRRTTGALLLALAISVKFYPALFLLYFLVREDWRTALSVCAFSLVLLAAVPAAVLGVDETIAFYRAIAAGVESAEGTSGLWADAPNKQHLPAVLMRYLGPEQNGERLYVFFLAAGWVWALGHLVLLARPSRSGAPHSATFSFTILFLSLPLVVSPAWPHYFAYLPFCQLALLSRAAGADGHRRAFAYAGIGFSICLASVVLFRWLDDAARYGDTGCLLGADLALLCVAYGLRFDGKTH